MIKSLLLRSKVELRSQRFLRNILTGFVNTHTCSDKFLHRLRDILPNYRLQPPQATESQERCCRWVNMPKRGEKIERKSLSLQFSCTFHYNGLHSEFQLQSFNFFLRQVQCQQFKCNSDSLICLNYECYKIATTLVIAWTSWVESWERLFKYPWKLSWHHPIWFSCFTDIYVRAMPLRISSPVWCAAKKLSC